MPRSKVALVLCLAPVLLSAATVLRADSGSVYLMVGSTRFAGQTPSFPVDFGGSNPYQYGDGGEFTAFVTGLSGADAVNPASNGGFDVPAGYAAVTQFTDPGTSYGYSSNDNAASLVGRTGFETFCVEENVDFYVGQTYSYVTGFSIQDPSTSLHTLTAGVAWLYQQFATGTLSGFDYTSQPARIVDAGKLQSAIWYLQGESADPYAPSPTVNNPFYNEAVAHFGGLAGAQSEVSNLSASYGVEVLELYSGNSIAQNQLVYVGGAVPESATTVGLLAASALLLLWLARFQRHAGEQI